jgi:hypothetical protein
MSEDAWVAIFLCAAVIGCGFAIRGCQQADSYKTCIEKAESVVDCADQRP